MSELATNYAYRTGIPTAKSGIMGQIIRSDMDRLGKAIPNSVDSTRMHADSYNSTAEHPASVDQHVESKLKEEGGFPTGKILAATAAIVGGVYLLKSGKVKVALESVKGGYNLAKSSIAEHGLKEATKKGASSVATKVKEFWSSEVPLKEKLKNLFKSSTPEAVPNTTSAAKTADKLVEEAAEHSEWGSKFMKPEHFAEPHFDKAYNPIKESLINQAKGKAASTTEKLAETTVAKATTKNTADKLIEETAEHSVYFFRQFGIL